MSNKNRIGKKQKALVAKSKNNNLRKGLALIQAMIHLSIEFSKRRANSMTAYPAGGIIEEKEYEKIIDSQCSELPEHNTLNLKQIKDRLSRIADFSVSNALHAIRIQERLKNLL